MVKPRILVIGNTATELTLSVKRIPYPSQTEECESILHLPSGHGVFASVSAARLGSGILLCSKVGNDQNGDDLIQYLKAEGVDTRFVVSEKGYDTEMTTVIRERSGDERTFRFSGATEHLSVDDVEEAFISYPDAVVLSALSNKSVAERVIRLCREKNIPLFVISSTGEEFRVLHQYGCEVFSVSDKEALALTSVDPCDQTKCLKICMTLMDQVNAKHILLRLRDRGYFIYDGTYYDFISDYDLPPVKESPDDTFSAAFVLEYMRSEGNVKRSAEFAALVCAVYLSRGGGLRACPTDPEVRRFASRNGIDYKFDTDYFGEE